MRKDMGRRLRDGVTAKLEYDFACERGHAFGEYHLHGAINEIISAIIDPGLFKLHGGYAHDAINAAGAKKAGRPREVDFYIDHRDTGAARTCIEAKWAGSSHCTWRRILIDLYRLTLVKNSLLRSGSNVECLFVLSGQTKDINSLLSGMPSFPQALGSRASKPPLAKQEAVPGSPLYTFHSAAWTVEPAIIEALPGVPPRIYSNLIHDPARQNARWATMVWRIGPDELPADYGAHP